MEFFNDRNSFVRKTTRKIKELELPEKCKDSFNKAVDSGTFYKDKAVDFARDVAEKADIKGKYNKVKSSVKKGIDSVSCKFNGRKENCPLCGIKEKICNFARSAVQKVRDKNPIALAVCAGAAVFAVFGIFYSVFYTIFSLKKRK